MNRSLSALAVFGAILGLSGAAQAQAVQALGEFRDWSAYTANDNGQVCFALSKAKSISPEVDGYTGGVLYLTNRPAEGVSNEVNLIAGFNFAPEQPATLIVGSQSFALFTQQDGAWLLDRAQSDALAAAMRAGSTLTVEGTTERGLLVTETFSLSGATAASRAIAGC